METDLPQPCSSGSSDLPDVNQHHLQNSMLHNLSSNNLNNVLPYCNSNGSSASPGPLKKFRQTYGMGIPLKQTTHYTQSWMDSYHCQVYPQNYSNTPSITSRNSLHSRLSAASIQTELSIITDMSYLHSNLSTIPANYSSRASASSFVENIDPNLPNTIEHFLNSIILKLAKTEEKELCSAILSLKDFAKNGYFLYCKNSDKITQIFHYLFYILIQKLSLKLTNAIISTIDTLVAKKECIEAFRNFIQQTRGAAILAISDFLDFNERYGNYATNVIHTLLSNPKTTNVTKFYAKNEETVIKLLNIIRSPNCTYKHIALDALQVLICRSSNLMSFIKRHSGIEIFLNLMVQEGEERVLYRNALVISCLLNVKDIGDYFVSCGGVQILGNRLDHGSPRFLVIIAKCLSIVSDSEQLPLQNIDSTLERLIQLLGSADINLVFYVTGFIANAQTNNLASKIFLHKNGAIENLMCLINSFAESDLQSLSFLHKQKILELLDNALMALMKLTNNYGEETSYIIFACVRIMDLKKNYNAALSFINIMIIDYLILGSRVISLINRIVEQIPNVVWAFEQSVDRIEQQNYCYHLMRILFWAVEEHWKQQENYDCSKNSRPLKCEILIKKTLSLLINFAKTSNFFNDRISQFAISLKNPVLLLPYLNRNLKIELLRLFHILIESALNEDLLNYWKEDTQTMNIFNELIISSDSEFSRIILLILNG